MTNAFFLLRVDPDEFDIVLRKSAFMDDPYAYISSVFFGGNRSLAKTMVYFYCYKGYP